MVPVNGFRALQGLNWKAVFLSHRMNGRIFSAISVIFLLAIHILPRIAFWDQSSRTYIPVQDTNELMCEVP